MNDIVPTKILKAAQSDAQSMFQLIEQASSNPDVDPAKLHSLLDAQERFLDRQARDAYNEAVEWVIVQMPRIVKNKSVGYDLVKNQPEKGQKEAFKYAPLEDIDKIIAPLLKTAKLRGSFTTREREGGGAVVISKLTHALGHSETCELPLPIDTSGGKNNVQGMGSTFSYGRRYGICALLNIVVIGDDDDAQSAEAVTNEQAVEIDLLISDSKVNKEKFLKTLKVDDVRMIRGKDYGRAINALKAIIYDKTKGSENA